MSGSINQSDPRPILTQQPQLSDDDLVAKNAAVPTPTEPIKIVKATGGGVGQQRKSK